MNQILTPGPVACIECGSPGKVMKQGPRLFMVVPERLKDCELHKHPEPRCGSSIASMCRSGVCTEKADAVAQWNSMMKEPTK